MTSQALSLSHAGSIGPRDPAEDDVEPGMLPVDPDQGPVSPAIPSDPEHDRMVDPEV